MRFRPARGREVVFSRACPHGTPCIRVDRPVSRLRIRVSLFFEDLRFARISACSGRESPRSQHSAGRGPDRRNAFRRHEKLLEQLGRVRYSSAGSTSQSPGKFDHGGGAAPGPESVAQNVDPRPWTVNDGHDIERSARPPAGAAAAQIAPRGRYSAALGGEPRFREPNPRPPALPRRNRHAFSSAKKSSAPAGPREVASRIV